MKNTTFLRGVGAGLALGALAGIAADTQRVSMRTCVGRKMQEMSGAVDCALYEFMRSIR